MVRWHYDKNWNIKRIYWRHQLFSEEGTHLEADRFRSKTKP